MHPVKRRRKYTREFKLAVIGEIEAAKRGFKIKEVDVRDKRGLSMSKVTGSPKANINAAIIIFWTILKLSF